MRRARFRPQRRIAAWVRALAVAAFTVGLATLLLSVDVDGDATFALPPVLVVLAPPLVYAALAFGALRRERLIGRVAWIASACVTHAALSVTTGVVYAALGLLPPSIALVQALWLFPPAPFVYLAGVPLILWPFRKHVARPVRRADRFARPVTPTPPSAADPVANPFLRAARLRDAASAETAAPPAPAAPLPPPPPPPPAAPAAPAHEVRARRSPKEDLERVERFATAKPRLDEPRRPVVARVASSRPSPRDVALRQLPGPASAVSPPAAAPAAAPAAVAAATPRGPAGAVVRVPFVRVAAQFPDGVFTLPVERIGESLREANVLVLPLAAIMPQLENGAVEVEWAAVETQFPEFGLALPPAELRGRFVGWRLTLPLDEIVRQVPPGLFAPPTSILVEGIDAFPAPFQPHAAVPAAAPSPAIPAPPIAVAPAVAKIPVAPAVLPPPAIPDQAREEAQRIGDELARAGAVDRSVRLDGVGVIAAFAASGALTTAVDRMAGRLTKVIGGGALVTVRGASLSVVVARARHVVAAAGVRAGGPLAFAEIVIGRAAAPASSDAAGADGFESSRHPRLCDAAGELGVFGTVIPAALADPALGLTLYVFSATDSRPAAALARRVWEAVLREADAAVGDVASVAVRHGRHLTVVRPLAGAGPAVLVAAGATDRPGVAHRQTARAAAVLDRR